MRFLQSDFCCRVPALFVLAALLAPGRADAQFLGNIGGVCIDAKGMLRDTRTLSESERLKLLQEEAVADPAKPFSVPSSLRKVSLKRWEQRIRDFHETGKPLPGDLKHFAGLTAVRYVVFDPDHQDVILMGPAEPWTQTPTGEIVGDKSHRPVLHSEDLIEALRYAFSERNSAPFIGCSIDPTAEGVKRYARYMSTLRMDRSRLKSIFAGMEEAMGPQAVRLFGVAPDSRFALAMLAADYRLKRISLGHDPSPSKGVTNYLDLAAKSFKPGPQKQHRWWFEAEFDAILETPDHLAFELVGQGVQVVTSPTIPGNTNAKAKPTASPAAEEFAEAFTKNFTEIAGKQPVFAELQNLIALAVVAELIADQRRSVEANRFWSPTFCLNEKNCPTRRYHVPQHVPSIANYRLIRNRHWLTSVSGGVKISPEELAHPRNRNVGPHRELDRIRRTADASSREQSWWWDGEASSAKSGDEGA